MVDGLADRFVDRLVDAQDRLSDGLADRSTDGLAEELTDEPAGRLVDKPGIENARRISRNW